MVPSGLRLSVVSVFVNQMVTGDSEICKESVLFCVFSRKQMWENKKMIRCMIAAHVVWSSQENVLNKYVVLK